MTASQEFTAQQLAAARAAGWHQNGDALLTIESLRDWLNDFGLVLFVPRSLQIPAPAPSFAEALLGAANPGPGIAEMEQARAMLARLVAEGVALPLNLLGTAGDVPDFVVSAQIFSYIFTLRGDKAWKLPPSTAGAVKVSQLGLNAYEILAERGAMSAAQLVTELGREVTEVAVVRALSELWGHLRMIPMPQTDGSTLWELTTKRFTKQIKAGINAGQPKALSALISLYLGQAVAATEDEIATFLSPLAARSRIREVVHALMAGRQLETVVLEGKTLLHVGGELPVFEALPVTEATVVAAVPKPAETRTPRISTYKAKAGAERERRPFKREGAPRTYAKPSFDKPWEEEKAARPAAAAAEGEAPAFRPKEYGTRPPRKSFGDKPSFGDRPRRTFGDKAEFWRSPSETFGDKPSFGDRSRKTFGEKPSFGDRPRKTFGEKPSFGERPRKVYGDKPSFGDRPRKTFGEKPSFSDRPRRSFGQKPSFGDRPRKTFGDRPAFKPRSEGGFGDKPKFARKPFSAEGGGERKPFRKFDAPAGERKPFRKFDGPRPEGDRKPFGKPGFKSGGKSFGKKPGGFGGKKFDDKPGAFGGGKAGYSGKPKGKFGSRTKPAYPGLPKGSGPKPAHPRKKPEDEAGS